MYQQQILRSFTTGKRRPYVPAFRLQREDRGWRVFDRDRAIGLLTPTAFDLWAFSPFERDEIANPEPPGKVWDLHTVHNTYINLGMMCWPAHWSSQAGDADRYLRWTWRRARGVVLEAVIEGRFADGERMTWKLGIRYDEAWARYRYTFDVAARKRTPAGFEMLNLMTAGALTERPEDRRWTHSLWEDPDGRLRRVVHSNALFMCTDYAAPAWRTRNAPYQGAWVAYAAHDSFNPAILLHRTDVPLRFSTCSQLFDEHILWSDAGQENLRRDGYFHFNLSAEFVNLKPRLARDLLRRAIDPVRPDAWRIRAVALPFHMDRVNSFEQAVDPWKAEECALFAIPEGREGPVQWSRETAHSGRRSIRLEAKGMTERRQVFPTGAVCRVRPHRRYRLTGWIRTRGVKRFARLELTSYEYGYGNIISSSVSPDVARTKGWTRVTVELGSGDESYVMPRLVLYGPGVAWFDDVSLEEC